MLTRNLIEYMKRQNEIAAKVADGTAGEEEKRELRRITDALKAATGEYEPQCKTELVALTADEAREYMETESAEAEAAMDPDRLALLKRNLEEIKRQKDAGAEVFAIQRPVAKADDGVAELVARMDKIEAKFADLFAKLSEKDDAEGDDAEGDAAEEKAEGEAAEGEGDKEAEETEETEETEAKAVAWGDLSEEATADASHSTSDTYQALKTACGRRKA